MDRLLSCDTSVVLGTATADGSVIFAKNSDRHANECQPLTHLPRRRHAPGAAVRCQYLAIPQVAETWEAIGSRPYWLWGFEMGVNEWGVAVGNEAVLTREPYEEPAALIGMDLVRLGLERGRTADEATAAIAELTERYGQGGNCRAEGFGTYHNSYIVADPTVAWVLETAGRRWAARRVRDRAAVSNLLTIEGDWDAISSGAAEHARAQGWAGEPFSFAAAYTDPAADLRPRRCRLERARDVLGGYVEPVHVAGMQALLRDHAAYGGDLPRAASELPSICMHAGPGATGETAASMVAHLRPGRPRELTATVWTAFGSPCLSVFRLVAQAPDLAPSIRWALGDLEAEFRQRAIAAERVAAQLLEQGDRAAAVFHLRDLVEGTSREATRLAQRLADEVAPRSARLADPTLRAAWAPLNASAGLGQRAAAPVA